MDCYKIQKYAKWHKIKEYIDDGRLLNDKILKLEILKNIFDRLN